MSKKAAKKDIIKNEPGKEIKQLVINECANYMHHKHMGVRDCKIMNGEDCGYFETAVKPLLWIRKKQ